MLDFLNIGDIIYNNSNVYYVINVYNQENKYQNKLYEYYNLKYLFNVYNKKCKWKVEFNHCFVEEMIKNKTLIGIVRVSKI